MKKKLLLFIALGAAAFRGQAQITLADQSKVPPLVKTNTTDFPNVKTYSLISSWDTLALSPSFRFGGSADGAGIVKNIDGTYTMVVNHEDNFSVSRLILDSTFKVIKGEYILNSDAGMWRLCSGTMATPEEHGFGPVFLTCGESSAESMTHALNPFTTPITKSEISTITTLTGFGRWNAENAVPLPKNSYPGKTVVIIGDDDSGPFGGQLAMYISTVGDLQNGKLYVMRRKDQNQKERQIALNTSYDVEFVLVPDHKTLTGSNINSFADATAKSVKFGRVEDIDYRKGNADAGREIYFNTTGANYTGQDSIDKTIWGRVYRLVLDKNNPLQGKIECILDGDDKTPSNPGAPIYQPDNICVTEDYVYVQEDPNGYTMPWAQQYVHDGRIYQYDIETKTMKTIFELDHRRSASDSAMFNRNSAGTSYAKSSIGGWEYGAMMDISKLTGTNNTFVIALQPHSFRYTFFAGVDGGTLRATENQGSMLITASGIPTVKVKTPVTSNVTICSGTSAKLTASGGSTFASDNGTTYKWYNAVGTLLHTGTEFNTPNLTANTTYHVSTLVSGTESAKVPVVVSIQAPLVLDLGKNKKACDVYTLNSGIDADKYQWSTGASGKSIQVAESGIYKLTATKGNCTVKDSVSVIISKRPAAPVISVLFNMTLKSNYAKGNRWYKDGALVSTSQEYTVTEKGTYGLTYTNDSNCVSDVTTVSYNSLGIADAFEANGFNLFPNPNNGTFTLRCNNPDAASFIIQVVSVSGQIVYSEKITNLSGDLEKTIHLTEQAAGNYIVNIITDKTVIQKKIVKQ